MKTGLVTLFDYNYGSTLQCFATQKLMEKHFCECKLIVKAPPANRLMSIGARLMELAALCIKNPTSHKEILSFFLAQRGKNLTLTAEAENGIKRFIQTNINSELCDDARMKALGLSDEYAAFLSGSDQVWNGARIDGYDYFFLRFVPKAKRIAWAPSFGGGKIAKYNTKRFKKYISDFHHLSVRETDAVKLIKELTGRDATVLPDPIFNLTADEWRAYCKPTCTLSQNEKYAFLFFIDRIGEAAAEQLKALASSGMKIISFGYKHDLCADFENWQHLDGSPWDFLYLIDHAECVVTDSFHAVAFSTLLHTNFFVFKRSYQHSQNQSVRITDFLQKVGLTECFEAAVDLKCTRDYSAADRLLEKEREHALQYLRNALHNVTPDERETVYPDGEKNNCFGCGACVSVCKRGAISLKKDETGHVYPSIDFAGCVSCGQCKAVCPAYREMQASGGSDTYVGYSENSETKDSASGGLFASLARQVLLDGGVVFGAALEYENGMFRCKHVAVRDLKDLCRIQGSKYVHSSTVGVFEQVKEEAAKGTRVLFSGTSCQVSGLKSFLGREYDNLLTVDLIDHGVPSETFLNEYICFLNKKYHIEIVDFKFRSKDKEAMQKYREQMPYIITVTGKKKNGKLVVKQIPMRRSAYYRLYMAYAEYRPSCYKCRFANLAKPADITLGDYYPSESRTRAVTKQEDMLFFSSIIARSEKGKRALAKLEGVHLSPVSNDHMVAKHGQLQKPGMLDRNGQMLTALYRKEGFAGVQRYITIRNTITWLPRKLFRR